MQAVFAVDCRGVPTRTELKHFSMMFLRQDGVKSLQTQGWRELD